MDARELVNLLKETYSGDTQSVRRASEGLESRLGGEDLPVLLDYLGQESDSNLQLSISMLISRLCRSPVTLSTTQLLLPLLCRKVLESGYPHRKSRFYLESALSLLLSQHPHLHSHIISSFQTSTGPGSSSLLRLLITQLLPRDELQPCIMDFFPLLIEAGELILNNPDQTMDWMKQIRVILCYIHSNRMDILPLIRSLPVQNLLKTIEKVLDLNQEKLTNRAIQLLGICLQTEIVAVPGSLEAFEWLNSTADFLFRYLPTCTSTYRPRSLQVLIDIIPLLSISMDSMQFFLQSTIFPWIQSSDLEVMESAPEEFIGSYVAIYEAMDCSSVLAAVGEVLRTVVRREPWGLAFCRESFVDRKDYLGLAAISTEICEDEDSLDVVRLFTLSELATAGSLPNMQKCHFIYFLSLYLDQVFADDPFDLERSLEFLMDSAGSLTCKALSIQSCTTLADLSHSEQILVILDCFPQLLASGLTQLIPVIRCKGLYECIRVLLVEFSDRLGDEGRELVLQLLHRLRVELERFNVKKQLTHTPNSLLIEKSLVGLKAACGSYGNIVYPQLLTLFPALKTTQDPLLVTLWLSVLSASLPCIPDIQPTLLTKQLVLMQEMLTWNFNYCFPLINAINKHHLQDFQQFEDDLLEIVRKCMEKEEDLVGFSKNLAVLSVIFHKNMLENIEKPALSSLLPHLISNFESWYSKSPLETWKIQVSSLFFSLCGYNFSQISPLLHKNGINILNIIDSVHKNRVKTPLDRKSHLFGLIKLLVYREEWVNFPALVGILRILDPEIAQISLENIRQKRGSEDENSESESETSNSDTELSLLSVSVTVFSPLLTVDEVVTLRTALEDLKNTDFPRFSRLIGGLGKAERERLVGILHMESSENDLMAPRRYLVPKYHS